MEVAVSVNPTWLGLLTQSTRRARNNGRSCPGGDGFGFVNTGEARGHHHYRTPTVPSRKRRLAVTACLAHLVGGVVTLRAIFASVSVLLRAVSTTVGSTLPGARVHQHSATEQGFYQDDGCRLLWRGAATRHCPFWYSSEAPPVGDAHVMRPSSGQMGTGQSSRGPSTSRNLAPSTRK